MFSERSQSQSMFFIFFFNGTSRIIEFTEIERLVVVQKWGRTGELGVLAKRFGTFGVINVIQS